MAKPTVQCAWCLRILERGDESAEPIHGICENCERKMLQEHHRREPKGRPWWLRMLRWFFGVRKPEGREFSDQWWRDQGRKDHENKKW